MQRLCLGAMALLAVAVSCDADRVVLADGTTLEGKIVAEMTEKLIILVPGKGAQEVTRDRITKAVRERTLRPHASARRGDGSSLGQSMVSAGEQKSQVVCFAQVDGALENDLILVAVKRSCAQAKRVGAHIVVFEIDTPGGRLDVMQEICAQIEKLAPAKTVAYIRGGPSGGAFSAGAVLAVACDEIYMAPGTAIGAAAPVIVGKKKVNPVAQKAVSAIAARMRSLAEKNGHPPKIAGAMVDADIELRETNVGGRQTFLSIDKAAQTEPQGQVELGDWITTKGKLLTLTAAEATRLGFAAGLVSSRRELLAALGLHSGRMKDLGTSEALKEALARRRRYLVKLNGQIAAYEAKAKALDPAQFRYRRLKERVGFHEPGDFEDEGRLWRQRSDACVRALDACLAACRQKLVLARKYPEMKIDAKPVESKMSELLMLRERVAAQRNMGGSES